MKIIWKILKKIRFIFLYKILKKETRGVRVAVISRDKILLIKHPYDDFWVLPGGGIKKSESPINAAIRETKEEVGVLIKEPIKKLGRYRNNKNGKNDYVFVFVSNQFENINSIKNIIDKIEIQNQQWFEFDKLPKISAATKMRISEIKQGEYSDEIRNWN